MNDVGKSAPQPAKSRKPKKAPSVEREMLMAISGKGEGKPKGAAKETKRPAPSAQGRLTLKLRLFAPANGRVP
jgi:hypothetical protein